MTIFSATKQIVQEKKVAENSLKSIIIQIKIHVPYKAHTEDFIFYSFSYKLFLQQWFYLLALQKRIHIQKSYLLIFIPTLKPLTFKDKILSLSLPIN